MKITRDTTRFAFDPFTLNILVESEEEARALYAIFNNTHNSQLLTLNRELDAVKDAIGRQYYVVPGDGVIANGITYNQYYGD